VAVAPEGDTLEALAGELAAKGPAAASCILYADELIEV